MSTLSVAIMAHPARAAMVDELCVALDREPTVVFDRINKEWDTGRRSLLAYDPAATHHLVLQDDAVVCRDLLAGVERMIDHAPPGAAFSLYLGRVRPHSALIGRKVETYGDTASWFVMPDLHWGVGVVLPVSIIDRLVSDQDRRINMLHYDKRISHWLVGASVPVWYPWPSLIDHGVGPSLLAHIDGRTAYRFVGAEHSALDLDWTRGAVEITNARSQSPRRVQYARRGGRPIVTRRA